MTSEDAQRIMERQSAIPGQIDELETAKSLLTDYDFRAGHGALSPEDQAEFKRVRQHWEKNFGLAGSYSLQEVVDAIAGRIQNLRRLLAD